MTDRIKGFYVSLEKDLREEDALPLMKAVGQIRGVLDVEPSVSNVSDWIAESRAKTQIAAKLWNVLYDKEDGVLNS